MTESYPLFVAFHYDLGGSDRFRQRAAELASQCAELNIELDVSDQSIQVAEFAADFRRRQQNHRLERHVCNRFIPMFIQHKLGQHNRPIFYLHCDSIVRMRPPEEAFTDMDVGYAIGASQTGRRHILGSPVYFRPGKTAVDFLGIWSQMCQAIDTDRAEHHMLIKTISAFEGHPGVRQFSTQMGSRDMAENPCIYF